MAYNRDIPQPTDLISTSQNDLLGNFQAIDSGTTGIGIGFSRNHVTMTDGANGGLHSRVDYFAGVADPALTGFVASLYPKVSAGNPELFYRNALGILQLTNLTLVTTTVGASGYGLVTPWGITLNWGIVGVGAGGVTSATALKFQQPFPTFLDSIVCTGLATNGTQANVTVSAASTTGCNLYCANSTTAYFFAIGH